jgi:lipid-A-disaccharide synthase
MSGGTGGAGQGPLIFLIAGEPSGDQLGAALMSALRQETGGAARFAGLGGTRMAEQGLQSLFPTEELAIMGIVEVLPRALAVYRRIRETVAAVRSIKPDALVTIDSPSFSLEVSQRLRGEGFPLIHYVAPSVWAWKPWRARQMAGYLDHLLALLPFEPPYFERHGLPTTFVGHPAVEVPPRTNEAGAFRRDQGIPETAKLICALPGSRRAEIKRLAPVFGEALGLLKRRHPDLRTVVPSIENVAAQVRDAVASWPVPASVVTGPERKYRAFAVADAGLAASGTVAVELAAAGLASVIAYRVNPVTAFLAKRLVTVDLVGLPNLVLERELMPELLQDRCTAPNLAEALDRLLSDDAARQAQIAAFDEVLRKLGRDGQTPSLMAARTILSLLDRTRPTGQRQAEAYNECQPEEES